MVPNLTVIFHRFTVVGSNDSANWSNLLEVEDAGFTEHNQFKSWEISVKKQQEFNIIAFIFLLTKEGSNPVAATDVMMWENI